MFSRTLAHANSNSYLESLLRMRTVLRDLVCHSLFLPLEVLSVEFIHKDPWTREKLTFVSLLEACAL